MAIARYLFKLLFNCVFEYFEIDTILINPQMIQLLFDDSTTNFPLQIHSQTAKLDYIWNNDSSNFIWNHLVSNQLNFDRFACCGKESMAVLFKILAQGGNKFVNLTFTYLHTNLYKWSIKVWTFFKNFFTLYNFFKYRLARAYPSFPHFMGGGGGGSSPLDTPLPLGVESQKLAINVIFIYEFLVHSS
ncbi:unnamed protein product [Meloidogyne enterolobii]|uniref:Uncharacterized protein n=1 Tax=Meloidogyne enterolobii TaxID=390850 RepID=A0ACB1A307_MELEN